MASQRIDRRALPADMALSSWQAADGWRLRRFDWSPAAVSPLRGSLLFLSGRADFLEKYIEALAHWRGQGWQISGFDWRGQGGSRGAEGGADASLDPLLADAGAYVDEWIAATPAPHVIVGHSMGGHLVLRLLAEHRVPIVAAVLVAPMLGLGRMPSWLVRLLARGARAIGWGTRPVWGGGRLVSAKRQAFLTGCPERYADELWWREANADYVLGAPSWNWMLAATDSIARLESRGVLESIATPLLLIGTDRDRLVNPAPIRRAAMRLPDARLVMIDGAHELLREADAARLATFAAIDAFLAERASAR